jgi:hypothetical protein
MIWLPSLQAGGDLSKVKPGLSVSKFNHLRLSEKRIPKQRLKKVKASSGIFEAPTTIQSRFFKSKNKNWQHGMIKIQNNKLLKFSIFNKKANSKITHRVVSQLIGDFGHSYSAHPFKSFGKEGISLEWQVDEAVYSLSLLPEPQSRWTFHMDILPMEDNSLQKTFIELDSPQVTSILSALGIEREQSLQIAAKDSEMSPELEALFQ